MFIKKKIFFDNKLGKLIFMLVIVIEGGASMQMNSKNCQRKLNKIKSYIFGVKTWS